MRLKGKLINWKGDKGFGFIMPNGGGEHVFIHKTAFVNRQRTPKINDVITFSISKDKQGRYCANEASYSGEKLKKKQASKVNKFSIYLAVLYLIAIFGAFIFGYLPSFIALAYLALSMITFIVYAADKSKAKRGARRTPENTLHLLALLGGWPGAAIAQQTLRHKSQKRAFRIAYWLTVMINCGAFAWLLSPNGSNILTLLK
ncbi:MAG: cold shock and DUF1294 domain-containing protein [Colwellia sp.]|nr:cold shock and DUF1294 domain-containing protein [Colwellia sp.]MCW8864837.1 cold shock and DUF1294 domain-containing protein [Colwellia sp.]MCW9081002.1 cold shock and DUF1294 domain-containing protein [Colwellia sp.]